MDSFNIELQSAAAAMEVAVAAWKHQAECTSGLHLPMSRLGTFDLVGLMFPLVSRQANAGSEYMAKGESPSGLKSRTLG